MEAALAVAPEQLTIESGRIEGPLVTARAGGTVSATGGAFPAWPLDLQVEIESLDPALHGYLAPLGIALDPQGDTQLRVTGTLAAPYLSGAAP